MLASFKTLSSLLFILLFLHDAQADEEAKTYIIHMDHSFKPDSFESDEEWHKSTLTSLSNPAREIDFLYSYSHVMHGFSARLTQSQLLEIQISPAHIATLEESFGKLLTTYSPKFLGLNENFGLWPAASHGEGIIIGLFDTGIWPESGSFSDEGMTPVPQRWKGKCQNDTAMPFSCNNKLIGAQVFTKGIRAAGKYNPNLYTPRDFDSHGTHTSSTAAGNYVEGASQFGFASGTAKGVAPRAHLAMYKVGTFDQGLTKSDVLAAMDQALEDGVDVMSLSLGFEAEPYFKDVVGIASLSAIKKGVSVVCAAGNNGRYNTTFNGAPWIVTVGAGTLDRNTFVGKMTLGDGSDFEGSSSYPISVCISNASLYYGFPEFNKSICTYGSLNHKEVAGKVVVCENASTFALSEQVEELKRVNAYASIIIVDPEIGFNPSSQIDFPALILELPLGSRVIEYAKRVKNPTVKSMRFVLSSFGTKPAPKVAYYSSRGPNSVHPGLLKPDIIAPGSDILAAVPPFPFLDKIGKYNLASDYQAYSGTSMAAPHVAGVVALLKAYRPEWSPAAIRSAMMTTAYNLDNYRSVITDESTGLPATPLDYGAGHIDPNRAMDPGLVYDMHFQDYVEFICSLYSEKHIRALLRSNQRNCTKSRSDLNYPSFVATFRNRSRSARTQRSKRIVTNVGDGASTYRAVVVNPNGMRMSVEPDTLVFSKKLQTREFVLDVEIVGKVPSVVHGQLKWVDEHHHIVSSPVVALSL